MYASSAADITSALEMLTVREYDRVRLRLWRQFGRQLRNIPDAPSPDDLLHEAIEDLLADRRHCPLDRTELTTCLLNIVRSKVSHLYAKWKHEGIIRVSEQRLDTVPAATSQSLELREKILASVGEDSLLNRIIEYRLDDPDAKTQEIAEALEIDLSEMYNANRRLKARLRRLAQ